MNNDRTTIGEKILNTLKNVHFWTVLGVLSTLLYYVIGCVNESRKPKFSLSFDMSEFPISEETNLIYYLIPREYYAEFKDCGLTLSVTNIGEKEVTNFHGILHTNSVITSADSDSSNVINDGRIIKLKRRLVDTSFTDNLTGIRLFVEYGKSEEKQTIIFKNLLKGMTFLFPLVFNIDHTYLYNHNSLFEDNTGRRTLDHFYLTFDCIASGTQAKSYNWDFFVVQDTPIDTLVSMYEKYGYILNAPISLTMKDLTKNSSKPKPEDLLHHLKSTEHTSMFLLYPMNFREGDLGPPIAYYFVKFDTYNYFKNKRNRKIDILDMVSGERKVYKFKDTPEKRDSLKNYFEEAIKRYKLIDSLNINHNQ